MKGPVGMQLADGSSRRQAGRCIHIGSSRGDPVKTAQDVLFIPAVHTHTLSLHRYHPRQHRPHLPRRYSHQTRPYYQQMDVPPPCLDVGKDCSHVRPYGDTAHGNWLGMRSFALYPSASEGRWLGEKSHAEFLFGVTLRRWLFSSPMCWIPDASPLIHVRPTS